MRDDIRAFLAAALTAALPDLPAGAWDEGYAAAVSDHLPEYDGSDDTPNPYHTKGDHHARPSARSTKARPSMTDLRARLAKAIRDGQPACCDACREDPDGAYYQESLTAADHVLAAVLPDLLAAAWDEGFDAMSDTLPGDYYPPTALGISNPYREVLDLGEEVEQPSELLAQVRDAIKRGWAKCPLCQGSIRQTVGLTCELCGRYHGKEGEWQ